MQRIALFALLCTFAGVALAELSEKIQKKLDTAEATYKAAVEKADNARFYAVQKASADRVKALKQLQTEATKAGDLDGATEIKARIAAAEAEGGIRAKPKDVVKFGRHEYAIINEKAAWHVARRICEEMGGHLVTMETATEAEAVKTLCRQSNQPLWVGGTDEVTEGLWVWVTGGRVQIPVEVDNAGEIEHSLLYWHETDIGPMYPVRDDMPIFVNGTSNAANRHQRSCRRIPNCNRDSRLGMLRDRALGRDCFRICGHREKPN